VSWSSKHGGRHRGYQGPRVPPNLLRKSVPPTAATRRLRFAPAALTAAPPTAVDKVSSMEKTIGRRSIMTMMQTLSAASDRVMEALIAGLELEFGRGAAEGLAQHFIDAEDSDFCWDARVQERWLGAYATFDEGDIELDRVAVLGHLNGDWFIAICIIDGDEMPHGMMGRRTFSSRKSAEAAFATIT